MTCGAWRPGAWTPTNKNEGHDDVAMRAMTAPAKATPNSPRTILCGSSGSLGHTPASETRMNSPAIPSRSHARGQIRSNSRASLLSRTLRSKTLSGPGLDILWRADMAHSITPDTAQLRLYPDFNAM